MGPAMSEVHELTALIEGSGMQGPTAARTLSNEFTSTVAAAAAHWSASTEVIRCDAADVLRIDVGGTVFKTRRATLTSVPGSLLSSMFAQSPTTVFVDRDPRWFELIVTWLRDRRAPSHWPMHDPAWVHEVEHFGLTRAMFGEGCVYVIGGEDDDGPFGAGELYDPVRCEWREVTEMPIKRDAHAAAILNGSPHISGGYDEQGQKLDSVYFLDTKTASWKQLPSMTVARCRHQMVAVGGGLYAIGGLVSKVAGQHQHRRSSFMERYDPIRAAWTMLPDPREPRYGFTSAVMDNKIYIMGGLKLDGLRTTVVERFDVETGAWDVAAPMLTPRAYLCSAVVEGKIYAIGGSDDTNRPSDLTEIYDPTTNTWGAGPRMNSPRCDAGAVTLNGLVWIMGGEDEEDYLASVETYDPVARCWQQGMPMTDPKSALIACVAPF